MSAELMEYFYKQPRLGTLSTADNAGKVDAAYFGSAWMVDEKTVVPGLGHNRSFANLRENPHAVFMIMQPGFRLGKPAARREGSAAVRREGAPGIGLPPKRLWN